MRLRTLEERVQHIAGQQHIIMDMEQGLTKVAPSVMMFYGVQRTPLMIHHGEARQKRYLALIGEHITIQHYED